MGRVMAGDVLEGVGKYLHLVAPEREEEELNAAIRAGAGELAEADKDLVVDKPSEGAGDRCRGAGVVRDAAPLFDGDERRTILYLHHVMGEVLTRPYELAFKTVSERESPLDKIDKVCRAEAPF
jgi:hypothetical protein